jgi:hypothetical protein
LPAIPDLLHQPCDEAADAFAARSPCSVSRLLRPRLSSRREGEYQNVALGASKARGLAGTRRPIGGRPGIPACQRET